MRYSGILLFLSCTLNFFAQSFQWSATYQFPADGAGTGVVFDNDQNAIVCGTFHSYSSNSPSGIFISKYKSDGSLRWTNQIDNAASVRMCYDAINDRIFTSFSSTGGYFIKKIDPAGKEIDSRLILPTIDGTFANKIFSIKADNSGGYFIAGEYQKNFSIGKFKFQDAPSWEARLFVARFDNKDSCVWVRVSDDGETFMSVELSVDSKNEIIIAGKPVGNLTLGTYSIYGNGKNGFIAKLDADGNIKWVKEFKAHDKGSIGISKIATDLNSCIFVTGGIVGISDQLCSKDSVESQSEIFLTKLDPSGNCLLTSIVKGPGLNCSAIAHDPADDGLYIAGTFGGALSTGEVSLISNENDGFMMKFGNTGKVNWALATEMENFGLMSIHAVSADKHGNVCITGQLMRNASFGGHSLTNERFNFFAAGIHDPHLPTGTAELSPRHDLKFFPNPSNGMLHGFLSGASGKTHVSVYNIQGSLITSLYCESNEFELDLSLAQKGVYIVRYSNGDTSGACKLLLE